MTAHARPVRNERVCPPGFHQLGHLGGAGEAANQGGRTAAVRAQREHLACVWVGRARFGMQIIAIVPEHDEAEPTDRGEHRGPGAHDDTDRATKYGEPAPVPFGRAKISA